ncbi:cvnh domain-containing protein [Apiospora hydei]|uniref:Cvnh domain-containing protein n=1 Tax=Apiospora hydei TaxID=1337664 RepID=A0ABR1VJE9_9PEZI
MKLLAVVSVLIGITAANNWSLRCYDEVFVASTGLLTANCDTGDGKGTLHTSSLNLNTCYGWDGETIVVSGLRDRTASFSPPPIAKRNGNYGNFCTDCSLNKIQDPIWPKLSPYLNCTCGDPPVDAAVNTGKGYYYHPLVRRVNLIADTSCGHLLPEQ